jgi:hypothetical protein
MWVRRHFALEACWIGRRNRMRVRYEDFCRNPEGVARDILGRAGLDLTPAPGKRAFSAPGQHLLASNRDVKQAGDSVEIEMRRGWEREMRPGPRRISTAISLPFLAGYGYVGSRSPYRELAQAGIETAAGR